MNVKEGAYALDMHPGWQTSRGHKWGIFVDKKGEFSWTLLVTSRGQKSVRKKSSFWVNFRGHF